MSFVEEVSRYSFRLVGPRWRAQTDGRFRIPRPDGSAATVLDAEPFGLETNNLDLGPGERPLKGRLRELTRVPRKSTVAVGAIINAAVRHMPAEEAFISSGIGGFGLLAGMVGNKDKTCVGLEVGSRLARRKLFMAQFEAHRSERHAFVDVDEETYFDRHPDLRIGAYACEGSRARSLASVEPHLADDAIIIIDNTNRAAPRRQALEFAADSERDWHVVVDKRTPGMHPTLWNGIMVLRSGSGPEVPVELSAQTGCDKSRRVAREPKFDGNTPGVTLLHYGTPRAGVQDYPRLETVHVAPGHSAGSAFENSSGDFVAVVDGDVELPPDAIRRAVAAATDRPVERRAPEPSRHARAQVGSGDRAASDGSTFDDGLGPQTVVVLPEREIARDNLVSIEVDPSSPDLQREVSLRVFGASSFVAPAVRCSRAPAGIVATPACHVVTSAGECLTEPADGGTRISVPDHIGEVDEPVAPVLNEPDRQQLETYRHWLTEGLSRVLALMRAGMPDAVRLLIPAPITELHRRSLAALGFGADRLFPWHGEPTRFRTVYVTTIHEQGSSERATAAIELLRFAAESVEPAEPGVRLFVSRRASPRRRIANEKKLWAAARGLGFTKIAAEEMSFGDQVRLFAGAEAIAGIHGGGLANAAFMGLGSALCEAAPAGLPERMIPAFWNLAAARRQRYSACVGPKVIDPDRFERVLADALEAPAPEQP
jgi:hypothetical protein